MEEIRNILTKEGILFYDKKMNWSNATLDLYHLELKKYGNDCNYLIYGVELRETDSIMLPANYRKIDHHNKLEDYPSSLEQVCEVLNVKMTRFQELVAVNDKAYIPGMLAMGATASEIADIRRKDRKAQGVSPEDEWEAEQAIRGMKTENGVLVVSSGTSRFSAITDRLFPYEKLLIYTDSEISYYGRGRDILKDYFSKEIKAGKVFYGGGENGFIGATKGMFTPLEIVDLKNKIIQQIKNN